MPPGSTRKPWHDGRTARPERGSQRGPPPAEPGRSIGSGGCRGSRASEVRGRPRMSRSPRSCRSTPRRTSSRVAGRKSSPTRPRLRGRGSPCGKGSPGSGAARGRPSGGAGRPRRAAGAQRPSPAGAAAGRAAGWVIETVVSPFHCLYQDALHFHTQSRLAAAAVRERGEPAGPRGAAAVPGRRRGAGPPGGRRARPPRADRPCSPTRAARSPWPTPGGSCRRSSPTGPPARSTRTRPPGRSSPSCWRLRTSWAYPGPAADRRAYYRSPRRDGDYEPLQPHQAPPGLGRPGRPPELPPDRPPPRPLRPAAPPPRHRPGRPRRRHRRPRPPPRRRPHPRPAPPPRADPGRPPAGQHG